MRKLFYVFLSVVAISSLTMTTSCADDDDNNENQNNSSISTEAIIDSLCNVVEYVDTFNLAEGNGLFGFRFIKDGQLKLDVFTEFYDSINDKPCVIPLTVNLTWDLIETPVQHENGLTFYAIHCLQKKADNEELNQLADSLYRMGLLNKHLELDDDDLDTLYISVNDKTSELTLYVVDEEAKAEAEAYQTRSIFDNLITKICKPVVKLADKLINFALDELGVEGELTRSDWMADINDSVPICKISIPGTHDTFSYTCYLSANFAKTQELNLEEQWAAGIRSFDIRMCYYPALTELTDMNEWNFDVKTYQNISTKVFATLLGGVDFYGKDEYVPLQICHGGFVDDNITVLLNRNLRHAFDQLNALLENHSKETAIVVLKFDCNETEEGRKLVDKLLSEQIESGHVVKWTPGIKLGDVRGKIIVVARYNSEVPGVPKPYWAHTDSELYNKVGDGTVWGDNLSSSYLMDLTTKDTWMDKPEKMAPIYVQDLFDIGWSENTWDDKKKLVRENLDYINSNRYADKYIWAFNHMSGMKNALGIFIFMNYAENASVMNPYIEELLKSDEYKNSYTGIIPIDWAGWSELMSGGVNIRQQYNSRGATPPGTIINHNVNLKWHYADGTTFPFTTKQKL